MTDCRNGHPRSSMRQVVDRNGRRMSVCSDCRKKARAAQEPQPSKALPLIDRLLRKRSIDASGCWIPAIHDNGHGYRVIARWNRTLHKFERFYAHRVSFEHYRGPIPEGMQIDHLCRNRSCFNPDHMEVVTPHENTRRAISTITHCPRGHEKNAENIAIDVRNGREFRRCKPCDRERHRERNQQETRR